MPRYAGGRSAPEKKVAAAGATGSLTVLVVWVLGSFGVDVPPEAASAITVLLSTLAGYLAPHTQRPDVDPYDARHLRAEP